MINLFNYKRRQSSVTNVGGTPMGGQYPIRVQSMTTTSTMDTEGSVAQAKRIVEAGGEYVRLTTQGVREAENMREINIALRNDGYLVPLVADVHFNPKVADVAALYCEKVRINPGNYVDPARTFKTLEYTDEEYAAELYKIEERFVPFLNICKENCTAIRIGVNHGSLSDRIMSRYGDTPEGIVESCMEFLRICNREQFNDVVISIKASNTVVMVQSVRLLVSAMEREDMCYPIHLGVTEAGEGEDGRIKSAVGIGALLSDGIGDTIRVSLSEEPEAEIPVARHLVDHVMKRVGHAPIEERTYHAFDYLRPQRRKTVAVKNIGGDNVPVVIATQIRAAAKTNADYIYIGDGVEYFKSIEASQGDSPENVEASQGENRSENIEGSNISVDGNTSRPRLIVDFNVLDRLQEEHPEYEMYPIYQHYSMALVGQSNAPLKFMTLPFEVHREEYAACLRAHPELVVVSMSAHANRLGEQRAIVHEMMTLGLTNPVVFAEMYSHSAEERSELQIEAAADLGALMFDGFVDGVWLMNYGTLPAEVCDETVFAILQAGRLRTTKTEYISCPGCGRTLYDLRTTIARIKEAISEAAKDHPRLNTLKIGIMGCIVNGPGEMADADYGYVGAGRGKISLYRRKECIMKNIPEEEAVERLLALIENDKQ